MNFDTPLIQNLRDHLLGLSRHSIAPQHGATRAEERSPEEDAVMDRFRPFAELFYLVASSDGQVAPQERAVMMGAFRALTGGRVRGATLESFEAELRALLASEGSEARLEYVCSTLAGDREDAELAFTLASAIALADQKVDQEEEAFLEQLASWMGISQKRVAVLVESGRQSAAPAPID